MLPHVAGRPLTLVRCPQGRQKKCFFQRHPDGLPERMGHELAGEEGGVIVVSEGADLIELVQRGVLEIHVRGGRVDRPDRPDRLVLDLDPGEGVHFDAVREAAFEVRERLDAEGLASFALTTGGKGLHVVVPVERRTPWDAAKGFTRRLAEDLASDAPDRFLVNMSKARRKGKIFVDYLRNDRKASAIAPFSTRAREGAPFACPVSWEALGRLEGPATCRVGDVLKEDPTAPLFDVRQRLTKRHLR
jgi:bifunctional non-homologous end joining protein LigD